ncbi:MAG: DUF5712 family protein [Bacteroidota bacterium]
MNIKISKAEKGSNTGSSAKLARYLDKENKGKDIKDRRNFFSHSRDRVGLQEAVRRLDANKKNLGHKDAKFFLINISPSQKELEHIGNDEKKLMAYTRSVMDAYAKNFNKGLKGKDLMYFAKIEQSRSYHGNDKDVLEGRAKQGDKKPGLQTHIHVIVSRKDVANKIKLSPLSKHRASKRGAVRGGFDREAFVERAEKIWDKEMKYERKPSESFAERLSQKKALGRPRSEMHREINESKRPSLSQRQRVKVDLEQKSSQRNIQGQQAGVGKLGSALRKGANYQLTYDPDLIGQGRVLPLRKRQMNRKQYRDRDYER